MATIKFVIFKCYTECINTFKYVMLQYKICFIHVKALVLMFVW